MIDEKALALDGVSVLSASFYGEVALLTSHKQGKTQGQTL